MEKNKFYASLAIAIVVIATIGVVYVFSSNVENEESETAVIDALGRTVNNQ